MARILITGSADGLGLESARQLIQRHHTVYLHARSQERADQVKDKCPGAAGVLIADVSTVEGTRHLADQVNALGELDAVFLNAGLMYGPFRKTPDYGVPASVFVNVLAPYILSCLLNRPKRLLFISSILHHQARHDLEDMFWIERGEAGYDDFQAYSDSKFHVLLLEKAVARRFKDTSVVAIHPGWVPTKLSGKGAPDKVEDGVETYVMLGEGAYDQSLTGIYVGPKGEIIENAAVAEDEGLQEAVVKACEDMTGLKLASG